MQNWRPISLLNVDLKNNMKNSFREMKIVLPDLINLQQATYIKNRHNGENGR